MQQAVCFREKAYFEFEGLARFFLLKFFCFIFKYFGLTCESVDPVVCTASGTLT